MKSPLETTGRLSGTFKNNPLLEITEPFMTKKKLSLSFMIKYAMINVTNCKNFCDEKVEASGAT
jgi:hypothetical protein